MLTIACFGLLSLATQVYGHGYVATYTVNGEAYEGFRRLDAPAIPNGISWSFSTQDEGPVLDPASPDMICRDDAENAAGSAKIEAGQVVDFAWTSADKVRNPDGWAEGHRGPVITYIAPCNGDCSFVDKTTLLWTKIAEAGLISGPANTQGVWATDLLRQGNNSAMIPTTIAPGNYVIRNEIIPLHRANLGEPEFYMACANLEITKGGDDDLSGKGVKATELYSREKSKSIFSFSIYDGADMTWEIPGPALYAVSSSGSPPSNDAPADEAPSSVAPSSSAAPIVESPIVEAPVPDTDEPIATPQPTAVPEPSSAPRPSTGPKPPGGRPTRPVPTRKPYPGDSPCGRPWSA
ncbi:glycosyl hydrolase family 61 domain-containing protein [Sarocladium implicatum]|nr:glycosyl hydrolase family 61 domain-containing protein [Sarocladium implicatum]